LEYLFKGKKGPVETVVANTTDIERVCSRVGETLHSIEPNMTFEGSTKYSVVLQPPHHMTPRESFRDFIEREMD
jgi:hypothetical protein